MRKPGMGALRPLLGAGLAALLLCRPEAAANGAREGVGQWYAAVAPAIFPLMALMPLLTGVEAARAYEALLGGVTRRLLRLPGAAAPALAMGMIAGSPAGALSARRTAASAGMTRGQLKRLAFAAAGFSPSFYIGGVGAAMLGDVAAGRVLLRSQMAAQLTLALLLRRAWEDCRAPVPPPGESADEAPMRRAVMAVLTVGGWMALFGAICGALGGAGRGMMCVLDAPSAARMLAAMEMPASHRLAAISAVCGFGGVCAGMQNLAALRGCGVRAWEYWLTRLAAAGLCALFTLAQTAAPLPAMPIPAMDSLRLTALFAVIAAAPVLISYGKTVF